jgi:putative membrane protein
VVVASISPWVPVVIGLALLLVPAFYHIRQRLVRYTLTPTTIEIDHGVLSRTTQNVPLRRIQDVTVSATVLQRMLGFGDVIVDNASEDGGKVVVRNIDAPRKFADELLKQLRRLES